MSITRLQQARQMYAMGQRVAKTMDGSRPGYGGPQDRGDEAKGTGAYGGGNGGGRPNMRDVAGPTTTTTSTPDTKPDNEPDARDAYISTMYNNMPTPTVKVGEDKFGNPIEIKTTYTEKANRAANLAALNAKGISSFDPRVNRIGINPFGFNYAPAPKKGFWFIRCSFISKWFRFIWS